MEGRTHIYILVHPPTPLCSALTERGLQVRAHMFQAHLIQKMHYYYASLTWGNQQAELLAHCYRDDAMRLASSSRPMHTVIHASTKQAMQATLIRIGVSPY